MFLCETPRGRCGALHPHGGHRRSFEVEGGACSKSGGFAGVLSLSLYIYIHTHIYINIRIIFFKLKF